MTERLTKKEKDFADEYKRTGNGVKSALKVYNTESYSVAGSIATENLKKPKIRDYVWSDEDVKQVENHLKNLALGAENENVQLGASNSLLDRAKGKAMQKTDITTAGKEIKFVFDSAFNEED